MVTPFLLTQESKMELQEQFKGLNLWQKVEMTDPTHTKDASFGRKITAIDAYQQIKNFTEQFGACGVGWGYNSSIVPVPTDVCVVSVQLWIKGEGSFTEFGTCEWHQGKAKRLDSDAPKKATTDGLTKAFSRLGFNADVFLGMFEDNKYIQQASQEKGNERAEKNREAFDNKNAMVITKRLKSLEEASAIADIIQKLEIHFAPLYSVQVGQVFKNEILKAPIIARCEELGIDHKELVGG